MKGVNKIMDSTLPVPVPPSYKNRRGWLIAFGVIEILLGCFFIFMIGFSAYAFFGPPAARMPPGAMSAGPISRTTVMVFMGVQYGVLAAVFITGGIGSIRCRNWARILMLAVSALWLGLGVLVTLVMAFTFPVIMRRQPASVLLGMQHAIMAAILIASTTFMVFLPAVFLFFYSRKSVKATCLAWPGAEGAPAGAGESALPVPLAILGVWEGLGVLAVCAVLFMQVALVFGVIVHGAGAVLILLAHSLLSGYAAWSIFRRKVIGWNISMLKTAFWTISFAVTYLRHPDLLHMYRDMGINIGALRMYEEFPQFLPILWVGVLLGLTGLLVFLLYTRKYFPRNRVEA